MYSCHLIVQILISVIMSMLLPRNGQLSLPLHADITQPWFDSTDNTATSNKDIHAIYVDFRKVFHYVNHNILLTKLVSCNVNKDSWGVDPQLFEI